MPEIHPGPHAFAVMDGFECRHCGQTPDEVDDKSACPSAPPLEVEIESGT